MAPKLSKQIRLLNLTSIELIAKLPMQRAAAQQAPAGAGGWGGGGGERRATNTALPQAAAVPDSDSKWP